MKEGVVLQYETDLEDEWLAIASIEITNFKFLCIQRS